MKRTVLLIMLITIISKLFGFGREIVLSYFYGATEISDAYLISITIPSVVFSFFAMGISAGYIPLYSKIKYKQGDLDASVFTSKLINIVIVISTVIVAINFLLAEYIVKLFASGFDGYILEIATQFTKVTVVGIYFTGLVSIFSGYFQVKNKFVVPSLIALPLNIFIIISIVLSSKISIYALSYGYVIATASQLFFLYPYIKKEGYKHFLRVDFKDEYIVKMGTILAPLILGVAVNQINLLVDRTLASRIVTGGISALNYASRLNGFVQGIFVLSIVTVLYPKLSKFAANNDVIGLKNSTNEAIIGINLLVIPITIGTMVFSRPVVELLFNRGAFDTQALIMTSSALMFYSIGMIGFGLREVLSRTFYSLQDAKTPVKNATFGMILNIILNVILSRYLGIAGLALATSIAAIFTTVLLFISLRKKIGPFGMKQISISFLKILFASSIMGLLAKLSFNYLTASLSQNLSLLIAIGVGAVSYFVIIYFMKIEDVDVIVGAIKKKLGRGAA